MDADKLAEFKPAQKNKDRNASRERQNNLFIISGCNLSPLLFAIFIAELGVILNSMGLGIGLALLNIVALLFADDLVLIVKNKKDLQKVVNMVRKFFYIHRLEMSNTNSKCFHIFCFRYWSTQRRPSRTTVI